jgi:hypothetical protein
MMKHGEPIKDGTFAQSESVHETRGEYGSVSCVTETEKSLERCEELQTIVNLAADRLHFILEELLDKDIDGICDPVEQIRIYLQFIK